MALSTNQKVDIFNFFDYCEYLQAVYNWRKEHEDGFSHRRFSRDAGITSPNYLLRVLKGERTLSEEYSKKFCEALGLQKNEARYFSTLVLFNNETEVNRKEALLRSLLSLRYRRGLHRISDKKLQFFSKWYYPVIRELATILNFKNDYNLLARNCIPRITAQQAENAVNYLLKNGFLKTDESGNLLRTDPVISSGDEVSSTILRNYHKQTLTQSIEALDSIEKENRDISSLTLCVSRKTYSAIKKEIQDFRKRLLQIANEDDNPELVCITGFQLLPRSKAILKKQQQGEAQ
ncbi:MAG TPA: TIGR02147 family protein [Chitinispirillaceae bacterium]|nr:TIGR02147 family protein [Chitinispirillaceae bacterium]